MRVVTAKGSEQESFSGEGAREIETDRVHICFGSRVCSDGFLCQRHPSGAESNRETRSEKREAAHRGSRMRRTYEEPEVGRNRGRQLCVCVCVRE